MYNQRVSMGFRTVVPITRVAMRCPEGFCPKPRNRKNFLSHSGLPFLPQKRSRKKKASLPQKRSRKKKASLPQKRSRKKKASQDEKQQPSIDALPDECLFEILRRLPGGKVRTVSGFVSKRWLMLLSNIQRHEICDSADEMGPHGYLSRSLNGKKATDVRLAAIAVGTASRGGLGKLSIFGDIDPTRKVTNLGLKTISRGCPFLRVLVLWNLCSISDEGLCQIAKGVRSLERIELSYCPTITDKGLIAIAMNAPNLISVTLDSCSSIGDESLQALARFCPKLKCITLVNCPLVGDKGIAALFSSAGHVNVLTEVRLDALKISDASLAVIGQYGKALTDLTLIGLQNVNERGFCVMGKSRGLQKLKSLSITSCPGASDLGIKTIAEGSPNLMMFTLRKCPRFSDRGVESLAKVAESLESLVLVECHAITQCGVLVILVKCGKKLKALSLVNCFGIRDYEVLVRLTTPCNSLRSLTISNCPGFGDATLGILGRLCPNLAHVNLTGLQGITDAGIQPLVQSSQVCLVKVNLSECVNLTDKTVTAIAELHGETLELLNLAGCKYITDVSLMEIASNCLPLDELDVSQCGVTDTGIADLAAAGQIWLETFSIYGCSLVTEKSLPCLVVLGKTLTELNIKKCSGISFEAVNFLLDQIPWCNILS